MSNKGKDFEDLVYVISKHLHKKAEVVLDEKLIDKDTGNKRQVDIAIRIKDGPIVFLAIVEVRNRTRPVGVGYIEQVLTKRDSVGADKAIIVSKSGFYQSALEKARNNKIGTYTFEEALKKDWSLVFRFLDFIYVHSIDSNTKIFYLDQDNKIINPHPTVKKDLNENSLDAILAENENKDISLTARRIINLAYSTPQVSEIIDSDKTKKHKINLLFDVDTEEDLFFTDENGNKCKAIRFLIAGYFWRRITAHKTILSQYKDEQTGEILAEIVGFEEPHEFGFELILESPKANRDRKLILRRTNT
jgi:hypothetical protein